MAGPRIAEGTAFRTHRLRLSTPEGRLLAPLPELAIGAAECCWIVAPSGFGKSTLVKALAGLWRHGEGSIERPFGSVAFASQQVYLPLGSLEAALAYPALPETFSAAQYRQALAAVGLASLWTQDEAAWQRQRPALSGGERQRLALARLHLHRPDWIVLDEATSALDAVAEREVLARLRAALPDAAFIVIAHRAPQGIGPCRTLRLADDGGADAPPLAQAQEPAVR